MSRLKVQQNSMGLILSTNQLPPSLTDDDFIVQIFGVFDRTLNEKIEKIMSIKVSFILEKMKNFVSIKESSTLENKREGKHIISPPISDSLIYLDPPFSSFTHQGISREPTNSPPLNSSFLPKNLPPSMSLPYFATHVYSPCGSYFPRIRDKGFHLSVQSYHAI